MTKPIIYHWRSDRDAILRRLKQHPKYMWFDCGMGTVRMLRPFVDGDKIYGRVEVSNPRYVGRVSNV